MYHKETMIKWLIMETVLFTALGVLNTFVLITAVLMLYSKIARLSNMNLRADKLTMCIHISLLLGCNVVNFLSLVTNINMY